VHPLSNRRSRYLTSATHPVLSAYPHTTKQIRVNALAGAEVAGGVPTRTTLGLLRENPLAQSWPVRRIKNVQRWDLSYEDMQTKLDELLT